MTKQLLLMQTLALAAVTLLYGKEIARLKGRVSVLEGRSVAVAPAPEPDREAEVVRAALEFGVPANLALAVSRVENWGGDTAAVSYKGAVGVMQVMPQVHEGLVVALCGKAEYLVELRCNARVGVFILRDYYLTYGSWEKALRAYVGATSRRTQAVGDRYVEMVEAKLGGAHGLF